MTVPLIAFFNNKGGVGKTTLVYHLAWMYADLGRTVLAADLDPQANLTAAFLDEARLEQLWPEGSHPETVFGALEPLVKGTGDIVEHPYFETVNDRLHLLVGDLALGRFEDELSQQWPHAADGKERAFRVLSAFWRLIQRAAASANATFVLVDLGPNLGALNRAALIASDFLVVPLAPDLFSLQGLQNLGPTVRQWRTEWAERRAKSRASDLGLPEGRIEPSGYVLMQHAVRLERPTAAYDRWAKRIPAVYERAVQNRESSEKSSAAADPNCLGLMKHYRSLMPMAQEVRKPIFHLQPADGAIGSHAAAAQQARADFERLALRLEGQTTSKWHGG